MIRSDRNASLITSKCDLKHTALKNREASFGDHYLLNTRCEQRDK